MKNLVFLGLFLCFLTNLGLGQIVNLNPDPNGDAWISGDARAPILSETCGTQEFICTSTIELPVEVNNSLKPYFPYIINQDPFNRRIGSCVQVAEIFYTFTYEINRKRGLQAGTVNNPVNLYNQHYTYNQNFQGDHTGGSDYLSGFCSVIENGCPSYIDFDDIVLHPRPDTADPEAICTYWMTVADKYIDGMSNTIKRIDSFQFGFSPSNLNDLKHWIADHGDNEANNGGLAVIGIFTKNWNPDGLIPIGQYLGKSYIIGLGTSESEGHALTIVGYNDTIPISDLNGNGIYEYTSSDIRQLERGAFIVANSWGAGWKNEGFIYLPYYLLYPTNIGLDLEYAYTCDVFNGQNETIPEVELAINLGFQHDSRSYIAYSIGQGSINNGIPDSWKKFKDTFTRRGEHYPMRGKTYKNPIEISLNYGHYYPTNYSSSNQFQKFYLNIRDTSGIDPLGQVLSVELVDRRWNEDFKINFDTHTGMIYHGDNIYTLDYHLLPHDKSNQNISIPTTINSNRISRFTTNVVTCQLTLAANTTIEMYDGTININPYATFILNDKSKIIAKRGYNRLNIDGALNLIGEVEFIADVGSILEINLNGQNFTISNAKFSGINGGYVDLNLNNTVTQTFINSSQFIRTNIINSADNLYLNDCLFENHDGYIYTKNGNVSCVNSNFINTGLFCDNLSSSENDFVIVENCNFYTNAHSLLGICVNNYPSYSIINNSIQGYYDGVNLFYAGYGREGNQKIESNVIFNCQENGILAYNSTGIIFNNNIYNNYYGVRFMNNCNFQLTGNQYAHYYSETQQIADNLGIDVYAASNSFPTNFQFNSIRDSDNVGNPDDPLLLWDVPQGVLRQTADVRSNNWGSGFVASVDLGNSNVNFLVDPIWHIMIGPPPPPPEDKVLYETALNNFAIGNDAEAKTQYQSIIEQYPSSLYAKASMKDLLRLEQSTDQNYTSLQDYYSMNDSIQSDSLLTSLANILVNDCNIKLQNYSAAIDWYEGVLDNPPSETDSIYAIIDLGYVYTLIEQEGLKSNFTGRYAEHKPVDVKDFQKIKNYLLSLIPAKISDPGVLTDNASGSFTQSYPNPSSDRVTLTYTVKNESNVFVRLVDNTGKSVNIYNEGTKYAGSYKVEISVLDLSPGIYHASLFINGELADTEKLSIVR